GAGGPALACVRGAGQMNDIETLVAELEQLPEVPREKARALVEATLALHRDGLARILELGGAPLREAAVHDGLVSALLALHDLHPLGLAERARAAVERARAELGAAGGALPRWVRGTSTWSIRRATR